MTHPSFFPVRLRLGAAALGIATVAAAWWAFFNGNEIWTVVLPILCFGPALVLKSAAPSVPWGQVVACGFCLLAIHLLVELAHWPPAAIVGDKVSELACVSGFGAYWVFKGYVPVWANRW